MNGKKTKLEGTFRGADELNESTFKLSNDPNIGKQLRNKKENQLPSMPNLEELFALSQHTKSNYEEIGKNSNFRKNDSDVSEKVHTDFEQILNRAMNPYSSITGKIEVTQDSKYLGKPRKKIRPEVSLGKINTIQKFRQYKSNANQYEKQFKQTKKKIMNKKEQKKKTNKKIVNKKVEKQEKVSEKISIIEEIPLIETQKIDEICDFFANLKEMETPYRKFEEGKNVVQYLFEDSKEVSEKEMFHFLLLTNHFFNKHLNN